MPNSPPHDYVTNVEFNRWFTEESQFRDRLESRMAETARVMGAGLVRIDMHMSLLDGSAQQNTLAIGDIDRRLTRIEENYEQLVGLVQSVKNNGCAKYAAHSQLLTDLSVAEWTPKKKAVVGGGIFAGGALIWPAVQEIARGVHALFEWMGSR
jgi:hypothetical protein